MLKKQKQPVAFFRNSFVFRYFPGSLDEILSREITQRKPVSQTIKAIIQAGLLSNQGHFLPETQFLSKVDYNILKTKQKNFPRNSSPGGKIKKKQDLWEENKPKKKFWKAKDLLKSFFQLQLPQEPKNISKRQMEKISQLIFFDFLVRPPFLEVQERALFFSTVENFSFREILKDFYLEKTFQRKTRQDFQNLPKKNKKTIFSKKGLFSRLGPNNFDHVFASEIFSHWQILSKLSFEKQLALEFFQKHGLLRLLGTNNSSINLSRWESTFPQIPQPSPLDPDFLISSSTQVLEWELQLYPKSVQKKLFSLKYQPLDISFYSKEEQEIVQKWVQSFTSLPVVRFSPKLHFSVKMKPKENLPRFQSISINFPALALVQKNSPQQIQELKDPSSIFSQALPGNQKEQLVVPETIFKNFLEDWDKKDDQEYVSKWE